MNGRNKHAFSLVELLVVIATIAILAGLLLPALGRAKALTRRMACLSNLKQWNTAILTYKDDHDDLLPREKCVDADHTWDDVVAPANSDVWFNALPPDYFGRAGADGYASDAQAFLCSRIFQCPTARFQAGISQPRFSLAMNSQLSKGTNLQQHVRYSSILSPAQTVLFLECGVKGEMPQVSATQKPYNSRPYSWAVRFSARHNRGSNLAFADGSAKWYLGLDVVDPATGLGYDPPTEVLWTP